MEGCLGLEKVLNAVDGVCRTCQDLGGRKLVRFGGGFYGGLVKVTGKDPLVHLLGHAGKF